MRRYLETSIKSDLASKLILISGPRQAGKTTLARQIAEANSQARHVYLNWDHPEHRKAIRSLDWPRSAPVKVYFWDWSEIEEKGPRLENLVASHLLKLCHYFEDVEGLAVELRYIRDTSKREVDFLLIKDNKPWVLVEVKTQDTRPSTSLSYFAKRLQVKYAYQLTLKTYRGETVIPCWDFLSKLP